MARRRLPVRLAAAALAGSATLAATGCGAGATHSASELRSASAANARLRAAAALAPAAARYLVIAKAGNERLEDDFDPLEGRDRNRLRPSDAKLRAAAATERLFDARLLQIAFPARTEPVVRELYRVNQARAKLTVAASTSMSLSELHAYERRLDFANTPVEQAVTTIRRELGLPPPSTS